MCFFFSCCGWALDFFQRIITCLLASIMCCLVGLVLVIGVGAGIAYGYNYSMSEFILSTGQDMSVYMRHGEFNEKPHLNVDSSFMADKDNLLYIKKSEDYRDPDPGAAKSLRLLWSLVNDKTKYVEKLTKLYSKSDGGVQKKPPPTNSSISGITPEKRIRFYVETLTNPFRNLRFSPTPTANKSKFSTPPAVTTIKTIFIPKATIFSSTKNKNYGTPTRKKWYIPKANEEAIFNSTTASVKHKWKITPTTTTKIKWYIHTHGTPTRKIWYMIKSTEKATTAENSVTPYLPTLTTIRPTNRDFIKPLFNTNLEYPEKTPELAENTAALTEETIYTLMRTTTTTEKSTFTSTGGNIISTLGTPTRKKLGMINDTKKATTVAKTVTPYLPTLTTISPTNSDFIKPGYPAYPIRTPVLDENTAATTEKTIFTPTQTASTTEETIYTPMRTATITEKSTFTSTGGNIISTSTEMKSTLGNPTRQKMDMVKDTQKATTVAKTVTPYLPTLTTISPTNSDFIKPGYPGYPIRTPVFDENSAATTEKTILTAMQTAPTTEKSVFNTKISSIKYKWYNVPTATSTKIKWYVPKLGTPIRKWYMTKATEKAPTTDNSVQSNLSTVSINDMIKTTEKSYTTLTTNTPTNTDFFKPPLHTNLVYYTERTPVLAEYTEYVASTNTDNADLNYVDVMTRQVQDIYELIEAKPTINYRKALQFTNWGPHPSNPEANFTLFEEYDEKDYNFKPV